MPVSKEFTEAVVERLGAARLITYRKMFGGLGFYLDDVFFAIGDDNRLFFKVDDVNRPAYLDLGMEVWICGGVEAPTYREVPDLILNDPEKCGEWIDASVEAARRLKKKPKK